MKQYTLQWSNGRWSQSVKQMRDSQLYNVHTIRNYYAYNLTFKRTCHTQSRECNRQYRSDRFSICPSLRVYGTPAWRRQRRAWPWLCLLHSVAAVDSVRLDADEYAAGRQNTISIRRRQLLRGNVPLFWGRGGVGREMGVHNLLLAAQVTFISPKKNFKYFPHPCINAVLFIAVFSLLSSVVVIP